MVRGGLLTIAAILVVVVLLPQTASGIKCWRCSSDASSATFCNDPFDESKITEQQRRWAYVECPHPPDQANSVSSDQQTVCKKVKQTVNDKVVISRSCYWANVNADRNECMNDKTPSYVKVEFCETCSTDGCNAN